MRASTLQMKPGVAPQTDVVLFPAEGRMDGNVPPPTESRRRRPAPQRRSFEDAVWGAISGALAGGVGVMIYDGASPPVGLAICVFAVVGAVFGYWYGDRVHAALWNALFGGR